MGSGYLVMAGDLGDHTQKTDNHPTGGENLHLAPQTGGQD